jgi:hypothetical protein
MTHSRFHNFASALLLSLTILLGGCATGKTTSGPSTTGTLPTESRQSADPERKDKKPHAVGDKKPAQNRTSTDETSGPPAPAKPPAIGGSGG